jgi:hypothetical protein
LIFWAEKSSLLPVASELFLRGNSVCERGIAICGQEIGGSRNEISEDGYENSNASASAVQKRGAIAKKWIA